MSSVSGTTFRQKKCILAVNSRGYEPRKSRSGQYYNRHLKCTSHCQQFIGRIQHQLVNFKLDVWGVKNLREHSYIARYRAYSITPLVRLGAEFRVHKRSNPDILSNSEDQVGVLENHHLSSA